jgi:glycerophosphoryl diester phosphodiesterase
MLWIPRHRRDVSNCVVAQVARKLCYVEFQPMKRPIQNIAHRGASMSSPENTLAAFRAAIDEGAGMCELDAQLTKDGEVVVIHDKTVDRTTNGSGVVAQMTLAEIQRLDAGRGERVPTLDEVFAATAGKCSLNIELKDGRVEAEVAKLLRKWNAVDSSVVSSFDLDSLKIIHEIDPAVRVCVLGEENPVALFDAAAKLRAYAVNPRFDLARPDFCEKAHASGFQVLVWTVDEPDLMSLLIENGVDGIMTNYPAKLRDLIGG